MKAYLVQEDDFLFLNTVGAGDEVEVSEDFYNRYLDVMVEFDAMQDELNEMFGE